MTATEIMAATTAQPSALGCAGTQDSAGRIVYATGGRTRRHAESNALNGLGAPINNEERAHDLFIGDDGPS